MNSSKINIHNRKIETRRKGVAGWRVPATVKKNLLRFLDELELGRVNKGRKISEVRQAKYLDMLRPPLEFWGKPEAKITIKDIENFERVLSSGELQSKRGKSYSQATKVDIRRGLKVYLAWKLGTTKAAKLTDWLDTRAATKTPDYLKEAEIIRLFKACRSARDRFLVAVLFDSGARAGEFHNIRYEDIQLPSGNQSYVKLTLKEEYSKTKGRVISLFWQHSLDAVRDYLREREAEGVRSDEPVFSDKYDASRFFLMRLGKRVLGRSIHYHLFRHSSATHYASKLNRQQLCYRYGWAFSSDMPDVYISRAGMNNSELDEKFASTELEDVKRQLDRYGENSKMANANVEELAKKLAATQTLLKVMVQERLGKITPDEISEKLRDELAMLAT